MGRMDPTFINLWIVLTTVLIINEIGQINGIAQGNQSVNEVLPENNNSGSEDKSDEKNSVSSTTGPDPRISLADPDSTNAPVATATPNTATKQATSNTEAITTFTTDGTSTTPIATNRVNDDGNPSNGISSHFSNHASDSSSLITDTSTTTYTRENNENDNGENKESQTLNPTSAIASEKDGEGKSSQSENPTGNNATDKNRASVMHHFHIHLLLTSTLQTLRRIVFI